VRRSGLAAADRRAAGPAIHLAPARPAAQAHPPAAGVTRAPDPFSSLFFPLPAAVPRLPERLLRNARATSQARLEVTRFTTPIPPRWKSEVGPCPFSPL